MKLYRINYIRGGIIWKTSKFMTLEEAINEAERFNNLPIMSLERAAMAARVIEIES